jgi:hypothetical protein
MFSKASREEIVMSSIGLRANLLRMLLAVSWLTPGCTVTQRGVEGPQPGSNNTVHVEGTVSHLDEVPLPEQRLRQVAVVTLHASGAPVRVELAPGWFLAEHGLKYTPEATLSIRGERVEEGGESRVIASEVSQGKLRLRLRDEHGHPIWEDTPSKGSGDGKAMEAGDEH